jgi:hypothetical protein
LNRALATPAFFPSSQPSNSWAGADALRAIQTNQT